MLQTVTPYSPEHRRPCRSLHLTLIVVVFILSSLPTLTQGQGADAIFGRIRQSLPAREAGWSIVEVDGPHKQSDGSRQASFVWVKGTEEVSATVVLCKSMKAAKREFRHSGYDTSSMDNFFIDGIGDEAYLFPPVIRHQGGPFNLSFRKDRYVVWMNTGSKETILRCANHVVGSITGSRSKRDGS